MALQYSQAYRNFLQLFGSKKQALMNGCFELWSGNMPTSPDLALTGTRLLRVTLASGGLTSEVLSAGTVTLSGANGQVDSITVNGVQILPYVVVFSTSLTVTAALVAAAINKNWTFPVKYMASSLGAVITIKTLPGSGTGANGYVVVTTVSGGTLAKADINLSGGVNPINGITFGDVADGVLAKTGTWSGTVLASGTAGYFVQTGSRADDGIADTAPWNKIRLMGTCGTGLGNDYNMETTTLVLGAPHEMGTWLETLHED